MTFLLPLIPFAAAMWLVTTDLCLHVRHCSRCTDRKINR